MKRCLRRLLAQSRFVPEHNRYLSPPLYKASTGDALKIDASLRQDALRACA
jgi:hypothetical protein